MEAIYYNPSEPGSYGGVNMLLRQLKAITKPIGTRNKLLEWPPEQEPYNLMNLSDKDSAPQNIFTRNPMAGGSCECEYSGRHRNNCRYLLIVIDVFSLYTWALSLLKKNSKSVTEAYKSLLPQRRKPAKLQTDVYQS